MGLGKAEESVVVVGLVSFICEDSVGEGGVEEGSCWQEGERTEAHVQRRRGSLKACFLTLFSGRYDSLKLCRDGPSS